MKTKVTSDSNTESVPSQTTAVTTSAVQSSVWSICDISTDTHVELRDITPSISPVFTDDQVHELTRTSSGVDVLGEHFLPPGTFKGIDEVLSSDGQSNLLYNDPVLRSALKSSNHDVLLPEDLAFHGSMFASFDSIVEADRILNKRDEEADVIHSEVDGDPKSADLSNKAGSSVKNATNKAADDDGNTSGTDSRLRRSPRKRVQVKKDSDILKSAALAQKSISRGKDISKLKYANTEEEAPKKEVRRSGRGQKKIEKEETDTDKKEKESAGSTKKKNRKGDVTDDESSGKQDSLSKNVRRSPRNQSKAQEEDNKKATSKKDEKAEKTNSSCTETNSSCTENKEAPSGNENSKSKTQEQASKNKASGHKSDVEEKKSVRKSGRITRNKENQQKEEDEERAVDESSDGNEKQSKGKAEGKKAKNAKVKVEKESVKDEACEKPKIKIGNKNDTEHELVKQEEEQNDSDSKAVGKRKVDSIKKETCEGEEMVKTKRGKSANREKKEKENDKKSDKESAEKVKESTTMEDPAIKVKEDNVISEKEEDRPVEGSRKKVDAEGIKSRIKQDVSENLSPTKESLKNEKPGQGNEEPQDESSDEHEEEEYNEDSDYDPEYDPDRLWCVCRKPHGNKFMICCDHCEEWFHGICVGITMAQGRQMERNGQEYTCPKCRAKIEEETKKGQSLTDPTVKENNESASSTEQGEKSPSKRHHHSRKDHSLKIKLPSPEKRKRRLRRSRDEIFEDVNRKRIKELNKPSSEHMKEEKTTKALESRGFRIPKKVRTTPTPALHSHPPAHQKCIRTGCSMMAEHHSLYCSHGCIQRHAEDSVNVILEEKRKRLGSRSSVSSSKNVTPPTPTLLGSSSWDSQQPTVSSHSESSSQLREGIAVIERSTGRVIAGVAAPSQDELVDWLQDHPSFEVLCPTVKDDKKKEKKEDSEKTVRESIRKSLKDILTTRSKDQPDVIVSGEEIDKCSHSVEGEMYSFFGDTGYRYKNKYRSLMFNLKDPRNKVLFRHVLSGEITVDRLVRMTPEQLASPELATWREQETKHTLEMIKMNQEEINATKAHIKKTHKGEVEIDDDDLSSLENSVKANAELNMEKDLPDSNTSPNILLLDTTDEHRIHLFDLNCRICTGKMAPPGEPPRRETPSPLVSTTSIVQTVAESSMPSPTPMEISTSANSPDSATVSQAPLSPSVLSKTQKKAAAVWKGFVMMQGVAKFGTSAYRVSGSCDDLLHLLPDTLHVQGRIAHDQVWDYLTQLKSSTSREVCVIRYEASSDDEKLSYVSLYSYFYSRKRCGVVSNCYTGVKDMYLVPLASHQPIPPELLPFDGPGLDEPRPHMLLGVIVRSKALFKRPRALSQRSLSPPPKRRTSSAGAETNSSDGGTGDSPSRKSGDTSFSELRDSPPADIDDIVFQYNTTQAKMASKVGKESPVKTSPSSETIASPTTSKDSSSVPALEAQKQQLLDLQERARQYILAQTQRKQTASEDQGQSLKVPYSSDATNEGKEAGKTGGNGDDDDAPYDPEEGLNLDLDVNDPTPTKPVVAAQPEEPPKASSLEMLVSTLQKLQGVAPNLSALTSLLPKVSTTTSGGTAGRSILTSETRSATAISSLDSGAHQGKSLTTEPGTSALASGILQPVAAVSSLLQPVTLPSSTSQSTVSTDYRSHQAVSTTRGSQLSPISAQRLHLSSQRLQQQEVERPQAEPSLHNRAHTRPSSGQRYGDHRPHYSGTSSDYIQKPGSSSAQGNQAEPSELSLPNRWNPSEPPQVNRQVNTASQEIAQYSGLRPEERARLAAHESRLESRENPRSSEHREENYDQRRLNDRQRPSWHNDSRFPRDSRNSRDDSRRPFREEYRHGRPWCSDDQRRDRFEHDRSRQNDRGRDRRFKEHWSRDRWRR